jgi:hypothetical protein
MSSNVTTIGGAWVAPEAFAAVTIDNDPPSLVVVSGISVSTSQTSVAPLLVNSRAVCGSIPPSPVKVIVTLSMVIVIPVTGVPKLNSTIPVTGLNGISKLALYCQLTTVVKPA